MGPCLLERYDGLVCDLDGVVYRGRVAVPHAVFSLTAAAAEVSIAYTTNNASRTPAAVAQQLRGLGVHCSDSQVVTSSQAGAERVRELVGASVPVLAVGGPGVAAALRERGLDPVDTAAAAGGVQVQAVLQGYGPDVGWRDLAEASYAVRRGAAWVATNDDLTLPTERGLAPGNGALVAALRAATGAAPVVVGKPHPALYELSTAVLRTTVPRTLAVGDRLDTDVAGASAAGMDALLVLTGVTTVRDLVAAPPGLRPRYLAADLRCLLLPYAAARREAAGDGEEHRWRCAEGLATTDSTGRLTLSGGTAEERLRAGLATLWAAGDAATSQERPGGREGLLDAGAVVLERSLEGLGARPGPPG